MRAKSIFFLLLVFMITGCNNQADPYLPVGQSFINTKIYTSEQLDRDARRLISRKSPILIRGQITHFDNILGSWVFILPNDDLVNTVELLLVDFFTVSNNLTFPIKKVAEEILIEGLLQKDETVLRGYILIPSGYQFVSKNNQ